MATHKGRAVRVEVALTYAATKTISAITKANPGAATSTSHGLTAGTIGHLTSVGGMIELEDQVVSVQGVATNTFNLEGINTTGFTTFDTSAIFTPVSTWGTLSTTTSYEIGGGDVTQLDTTTLLDNQMQNDAGMLGLSNVTLSQFNDLQSSAMAFVRAAAISNSLVIFRITNSNTERRIFRGYPSLPSESLSVNQMATGNLSIVVKKQLLFLPVAS